MTFDVKDVVIIISGIAAAYATWRNVRNQRATGDKDISAAWLSIVQPLRDQLEAATKEITAAKARITELESQQRSDKALIAALSNTVKTQEGQIKALEYQVQGLGGDPIDFHKAKA